MWPQFSQICRAFDRTFIARNPNVTTQQGQRGSLFFGVKPGSPAQVFASALREYIRGYLLDCSIPNDWDRTALLKAKESESAAAKRAFFIWREMTGELDAFVFVERFACGGGGFSGQCPAEVGYDPIARRASPGRKRIVL
jgi:hypothetical protein